MATTWYESDTADIWLDWSGFEDATCECGKSLDDIPDGEEDCPNCGRSLLDIVMPRCAECNTSIRGTFYTNMDGGDDLCASCKEKEDEKEAAEVLYESNAPKRIAWWRHMAARMLKWRRLQYLTMPAESWQAYRAYLLVKQNYRDEDTSYQFLEHAYAQIARHLGEDYDLPWQVLKIELNKVRDLFTY